MILSKKSGSVRGSSGPDCRHLDGRKLSWKRWSQLALFLAGLNHWIWHGMKILQPSMVLVNHEPPSKLWVSMVAGLLLGMLDEDGAVGLPFWPARLSPQSFIPEVWARTVVVVWVTHLRYRQLKAQLPHVPRARVSLSSSHHRAAGAGFGFVVLQFWNGCLCVCSYPHLFVVDLVVWFSTLHVLLPQHFSGLLFVQRNGVRALCLSSSSSSLLLCISPQIFFLRKSK